MPKNRGDDIGSPILYRIRLAGHLDGQWSDWFEGMDIISQGDETAIVGTVRDQSALHGLLKKVRDLGLALLAVERVDITVDGPDAPDTL